MSSWVELKRVVFASLAVLALAGAPACDDDEENGGTTDTGGDQGTNDQGTNDQGTNDAGDANGTGDMVEQDMLPDVDEEVEDDTGTGDVEDEEVSAGEACTAFIDDLEAGLAETIGDAVGACGRSECAGCALGGGQGAACGPGGTMTSCVNDCLEENDFGSCATLDCGTGEICDDDDICRHEAVTAMQAALAAGDVDVACVGCYVGITACTVDEGCTNACLAAGAACDNCQCEEGCPAAFAACSGLPPFLECTE